nr:FAD/NAD(P)-binding protein [Ornithinimicrobium sp. HY1745]
MGTWCRSPTGCSRWIRSCRLTRSSTPVARWATSSSRREGPCPAPPRPYADPVANEGTPKPCRIAVVGNGPRALWALERLLEHLRANPTRPHLQVDVFGPGELGSGTTYDPEQPEFLRLNLPADQVDVWSQAGHRGPSMVQWRGPSDEPGELGVYSSRASTGRYLREQAATVMTELDPLLAAPVVHHRRRVEQVTPYAEGPAEAQTVATAGGRGGQWHVDGEGPFDEVLLTPGHAADWPGALRHTWDPTLAPLHPAVFPVEPLLARPELRPGATVLVRGAALTGIDAVLALTRGRGLDLADADLRIILASRSGRLMMPKTPAGLVEQLHARAGDTGPFRGRAVDLVRTGRGAELPTVLSDLSAHLLSGAASLPAEEARAQVRTVLEDLSAGRTPADPVGQLRVGVAIARDERLPDGVWAVGQAWRVLQGDLARCQQEVDPDGPLLGWPDSARWTAELERLGYGPSLMHAEFLLEAINAGVVEVRAGDTAGLARELRPDLVIDAVLPPPGIRDLPEGHVLRRLTDEGVLTPARHGRGARVGCAGEVLDVQGTPVPGLSLIGRATEDVVLANDTLLRDMHPAVDLWAQRVLGLLPR